MRLSPARHPTVRPATGRTLNMTPHSAHVPCPHAAPYRAPPHACTRSPALDESRARQRPTREASQATTPHLTRQASLAGHAALTSRTGCPPWASPAQTPPPARSAQPEKPSQPTQATATHRVCEEPMRAARHRPPSPPLPSHARRRLLLEQLLLEALAQLGHHALQQRGEARRRARRHHRLVVLQRKQHAPAAQLRAPTFRKQPAPKTCCIRHKLTYNLSHARPSWFALGPAQSRLTEQHSRRAGTPAAH